MTNSPIARRIKLDRPLDLRLTLAPTRLGKGDPCTRLRSDAACRASRTPEGPVTLSLTVGDGKLVAHGWGPGAEWALHQLPALVGEGDNGGIVTDDPLVNDLQARLPGLRVGATHRVLEALVPAVCAQSATAFEAKRAFRQVIQKLGETAPGPPELDLLLPPSPRELADTGYQEYHLLGLEQASADIVRRAAARASALESVVNEPLQGAEQHLRNITGVGVWVAAMIRQVAMGDPDVVPVGDHALANMVAWVFAGQRHGSDALMLELLERFRGQRGRVIRLLKAARLGPPPLEQVQ